MTTSARNRSAKSVRSIRSVKPMSVVRSTRSLRSANHVSKRSLRQGRSKSMKRKRRLSPIPESGVPMDISSSPDSGVPMDISPEKEFNISESPVLMEIVDEYSNEPLKVDFGFKGLTISFVIIGHGGVENTLPIKTFKLPRHVPMGQINILGLRYSGLLNLVTKEYDESIDKYLSNNKNRDIIKLIKRLNDDFTLFLRGAIKSDSEELKKIIEEFRKRIERLKTIIPNIEEKYFGTKLNYGKKNAQKIYQGVSQDEIDKKVRHFELTTVGPLVKIYSILKGGEEILKDGQTILVTGLKENITLTEIIDEAIKQFSKEKGIISDIEKDIFLKQLNININIVDLTCNFTDAHPNIGFIE